MKPAGRPRTGLQFSGRLTDANERHSRKLVCMRESPERSVRLVIELHGDGDPIEGHLIEPRQYAARFRGWLELTSLIELVRGAAEAPGKPLRPLN